MAPWQAAAGAALLIPSGPRGENHLFIVLNDPRPFPGYGAIPCIVLVNVSTVREGAEIDPTCIFEPGCHPFVKQKSFAVYRSARVEPAARVAKLARQGLFKPQPALGPPHIGRLQAGLKASPFTRRELKQLDL